MDQARPKLPKEAIQLYNLFIHGRISRRAFMEGVQKFAIGGLTTAAVVEALMPNYARRAATPRACGAAATSASSG